MSDEATAQPPQPAAALTHRLRLHPAVRDCLVVDRSPDSDPPRRLIYVAPYPNYPDLIAGSPAPEAEEAQVAGWQAHYTALYEAAAPAPDPAFNTAGWIDPLTRQPLPAAAMQEWVAQTVARVRAERPQRILEIGCGTGLLLWRLAPTCREYWGTDFAAPAIAGLRQALARTRRRLPLISLRQQPADDFDSLPAAHFDTVILNSVVQYFPDLAYFQRVLEGIARVLAPRGRIFLGDIRSLPPLPAFHTALALTQAPASCSRRELQERIAARVASEHELLLDPALFAALPSALPWVRAVDIQLKRGRWPTEMARFRYDVILHTAPHPSSPGEPIGRDWSGLGGTIAALRHVLETKQPSAFAVASVPNARLTAALAAQALLADPAGPPTAGALRAALAATAGEPGIDPGDFWALEADLPYRIAVRPAASGDAERYDVFCRRRDANDAPASGNIMPVEPSETGGWPSRRERYANVPRGRDAPRLLVQELRRYLAARLPPGSLSFAFVVLDAFPRTADGEVDVERLPPIGPSP